MKTTGEKSDTTGSWVIHKNDPTMAISPDTPGWDIWRKLIADIKDHGKEVAEKNLKKALLRAEKHRGDSVNTTS